MPRAGSTLQYNVLRLILERSSTGTTEGFAAADASRTSYVAIEQLLEWGVHRVSDYVGDLTGRLFASDRFLALGLVNEKPDVSHIFGLRLPDSVDPTGTAAQLKNLGIHVSVRGQFVRISPHVYNDTADLEALGSALESTLVGVR